MKIKYLPILIFFIVGLIIAGSVLNKKHFSATQLQPGSTTTTSVRFLKSTITTDGSVTAQNQATLNFQTAGKLVYLPFKEGDKVSAGQTIAKLDTYQLQRQLTSTLNTYRISRDTFDQTQSNAQKGVLQGAQTYGLQVTNKGGFEVADVMGDIVKRLLDQNQATLDNSVINVELANYAMQLATLTSPLNGIITHEGVTVSGLNITPQTSFTIVDPDSMVFRANVPIENIYYISEGGVVSVALDGIADKIAGTVVKIYPSKVTLPSGQAVYQVDIVSGDLKKLAKLDQTGTAIIGINAKNVALVPAWTVLDGKYIWVVDKGTAALKKVTTGKIHRNEIEITSGLTTEDQIIIDPQYISSQKYQML